MGRTSRSLSASAVSAVLAALLMCMTARDARAQEEPLPEYGSYVYVEVLPEAILRVAPQKPVIAQQTGVSGVVMVHALVGKDGFVKDTRVTKSIPMLDAAAVEAVRQWRFKPALSNGRPVACWIAIPISFEHDLLRELPVQRALRGVYRINGSATDTVVIKPGRDGRVKVTSPGEWTGEGVTQGDRYNGTFQYLRTAKDRRNHGARGTHIGTIGPDGVLRLRGVFGNRPWPEFRVTWTPAPSTLHFRGDRDGPVRYESDGRPDSTKR